MKRNLAARVSSGVHRALSLFVFAWLGAALAVGADGAPAKKAKVKPGPEVLVVSDVVGPDKEVARPAPGKPVYYVILGKAERTLGNAIAGEPLPAPAVVEREIVAALAAQGYVLTQVGGPVPSQALVITWGTANAAIEDFSETDPTTGETSTSSVFFNQREIAQLVGADKANRRMLMSSEAEQINDAARQDRVYVMIAAMDVEALRKKQKKLIWRTRISIESLRHSLPESLHTMLASAAPYFGKETEMPVFLDDTDRRKAEVKIGTPRVVDEPSPPATQSPKK